ncbi:glucosyl-3-phosphoglycerate synthase [Euzebya sp.]|uniref:glucosyl-3-phosphoglycerate synthase n=1 Tax=Euzebya sp. TaxID=1971409 RepID=UPI003516CAB7
MGSHAPGPHIPAFDVDGWFARRTFDADAFDVDELAEAKTAGDTSVSVVLPAYDEAPTIGGVIQAVMELAGKLVDEVVVLDGGSTDGTGEVAASSGARVHTALGAFPELGRALGKGDALWRSLAVTSGDIVVFVDTDIRNPDPRFVSGLLGPLLLDPDVALVKAFYDRPIELDGMMHPSGGGRVTELLARPLLNLFWPELAGLVQPLSGEYAGRRDLLEAIPFLTGYGVEIGMLIDTVLLRGADAIAQVDLKRRVHRNQDITALSRMAFGVLQAALRRLPEADRARLGDLPNAYRQFARGGDGQVRVRPEAEVAIVERPPMASQRRA